MTNSSLLTARNNGYFSNTAAADAATEKIIGTISQDYPDHGESWVFSNLASYRSTLPTSTDDGYWSGFQFSDGSGNMNAISVQRTTTWASGDLSDKYTGICGKFATYHLAAGARTLSSSFNHSVATTQRDIQLVSIPIFEYQYFYGLDLEICPSSDTAITGRVHSDGSIYLQPDSATLTFQGDVTSAGHIYHTCAPDDPVVRQFGSVVYSGDHCDRAKVLKLPLGVTNTVDNVRSLMLVPPNGESATSLMGEQRFYNKADLVILVNNGIPTATSGAYNGSIITIAAGLLTSFLTMNTSLYWEDIREYQQGGRLIRSIDFDLAKFNLIAPVIELLLGRTITCIYVADVTAFDGVHLPAIRLIHGSTLPAAGLTIATSNPMYVEGDYNTSGVNQSTANTSQARPAALICDALTILSANWKDSHGGSALSNRQATDTTVNAAVITGIVPTTSAAFSGGSDNAIRLLEDWTGKTLTFNGAIAVLWDSRIANTPWGLSSSIYNPPTRSFAWDQNFATYSKLPPGTPEFRTVLRTTYSTSQSN
jgi:hypothetical protein